MEMMDPWKSGTKWQLAIVKVPFFKKIIFSYLILRKKFCIKVLFLFYQKLQKQ
jgi:hypothetical protein